MQVQLELGQTTPQVIQKAFRFPLMLKADNEIIRIANNDHIAIHLNPRLRRAVANVQLCGARRF